MKGFIVLVFVLLIAGCASEEAEQQETVQESPDLTYDECNNQGGEVFVLDEFQTACPDDMEQIGEVTEVRCNCICCR